MHRPPDGRSLRWRRAIMLASLLFIAGAGVVVGSYLLATRTAPGRSWLLQRFIAGADRVFNGRAVVRIDSLTSVGAGRLALRHATLVDSAGVTVLAVDQMTVTLDIRALWSRGVHLTSLQARGVQLTLRQDASGRPWNLAYIILGRERKAPSNVPGFGDDVRVDRLRLEQVEVTTVAPWTPHPMFVGKMRDSVIAVRDSLHDLVATPGGQWFERRRIALTMLAAHDAKIVDPAGGPGLLTLDSLRGVLSDPPVTIRHAQGRIQWTGDSLQFQLDRVTLPASSGRASGTVAWNQPGPVHFDARIESDAGLQDLGWVWDVLPSEGRGHASVHLRTLADAWDAEYTLEGLDVQSGASRVRGAISVIVRPAELALRQVDLTFAPLSAELMRRLSYGAVPASVKGMLRGRLKAVAGGPLTALRIDALDAAFTDGSVVTGPPAVSTLRARGMISMGVEPRVWDSRVEALQLDLRSLAAQVPSLHAVDGLVRGRTDALAADAHRIAADGLVMDWIDGAGHQSILTGRASLALGTGTSPLDDAAIDASVQFRPIDFSAIAHVDSTMPIRSRLAGELQLSGRLDSLAWSVRAAAVPNANNASGATLAAEGQPAPTLDASGLWRRDSATQRLNASARVDGLDLQAWSGRTEILPTSLTGMAQLQLDIPRSASTGRPVSDRTAAPMTGRGVVNLQQAASDDRPAFAVVASGELGETRIVVDSVMASSGGLQLDVRGALARTGASVDTLVVMASTDSLTRLQPELRRAARLLQPVDSSLAATLRRLAEDTLRGDASLAGYLYGHADSLQATLALGAREVQVGSLQLRRLLGSAVVHDLVDRPVLTGTASIDAVSGVGAAIIPSAELRVVDASRDAGRIELDISGASESHLLARARYTSARPISTLTLDALRLTYDDVVWETDSPVVMQQDSAGSRLARATWRSNVGGAVTVEAELPTLGAIRGALQLTQFPVGEVSALVAGTPVFAGTLSGAADLRGSRTAPFVDWRMALDSLGVRTLRLPMITTTGRYAARRLSANASLRDTLGGSLRIEGELPVDLTIGSVAERLLDDRFVGRIVTDSLRLQALPLRLEGVRDLRGVVTGGVSLDGTVQRPVATGTITLSDVSAALDLLGIAPSEGRVELRANGDSLILESLRLRSGAAGDTAHVQGMLHVHEGTAAEIRLDVMANQLRAAQQRDGTDLVVSGQMHIEGPLARPTVRGAVQIPRANLVVDPLGARTALDLTTASARALLGREEVPVAETAAQSLASLGQYLRVEDARVDLGNEVWVQTPESRMRLVGGLDIEMSGERLALDGEITANRGQYRLDLGVVNRSFSVDSGRVRFYGNAAISPSLDINATNVVRVTGGSEIPVRVHIGGTYDRPVLTLTSTDPLYATAPESEIISLLIFGAPTFALDGQSQSTVRAVTGVLLPSVGGAVEGALQRLLPVFNTVQVSTAGGQTATDLNAMSLLDNLSISAGKQVGERTFLRLNTGVCRGAGQTTMRGASLWYGVAAEYRLGRNLSGQIGVDPGASPCTRLGGDVLPRMQFGFDLFREWIW